MLPVCREDIAYVTGYVQKKLSGDLAVEKYGDREPPFSRCSQGLGLDFALKNQDRLKNNGFTYLNGRRIGIPKYFREKLEVSQEELSKNVPQKTLINYEKEASALFKAFESEMIRKNTWYPDNLKMMSIRFENWVNDFNFTLCKQIERDYLQKKSITTRRYI